MLVSNEWVSMSILDAKEVLSQGARSLIEKSFSVRLGATLVPSSSRYIGMYVNTKNGTEIAACASILSASQDYLFSEQYFEDPVEVEIEKLFGVKVSRSKICEIGGLSTSPKHVRSVKDVVAYFPKFAEKMGYSFSLVTVTSYIRSAFVRSGTPFVPICKADIRRLPMDQQDRWGNYYDYSPETGIISNSELKHLDTSVLPGLSFNELFVKPQYYVGLQK